jgi:hypothetical protein
MALLALTGCLASTGAQAVVTVFVADANDINGPAPQNYASKRMCERAANRFRQQGYSGAFCMEQGYAVPENNPNHRNYDPHTRRRPTAAEEAEAARQQQQWIHDMHSGN